MQGKKHFSEKLFTSFQLSSRVPEDNFYRRLKDLLNLQWLYKATKKYYGMEGQKSIDPVVFFKLIMIGYLENLASDRRIIATVSMRLDMLYFLGYDIDDELPWHSTLSRTRQLYGQDVFKELFREVLKQCIEKGMVAGRRQAVDSVQVIANASMDSLVRKDVLEDADLYISHLQPEDVPEDKNIYVADLQAEHKKPTANKPPSNATHSSKTDPDARIAKKPGKPTDLKYLAQVSVDTAHHVITTIQAHHADKRDSECLSEVVNELKENLNSRGLIIEEVIADGNYSSGDAMRYLEDQMLTGYIPNHGSFKPDREGFTYNEETDSYVCSQGIQLKYKKTVNNQKEYHSSIQDCKSCPMRAGCITGKAPIKKISHSTDSPLYNRMHQRMQSQYAKRMLRLRQSTAEPVIGTLVNFLAMRRINTRGIDLAGKCVIMAATVYNLKKMLKFSRNKANEMVKLMDRIQKNIQKSVFLFLQTILALLNEGRLTSLQILSITQTHG